MISIQKRKRVIIRLLLCVLMMLLAFGTFSFAQGKRYQSSSAWSFGVMADTQWTLGRPGYSPAVFGSAGTPGYTFMAEDNPNFISESIAKQIRQAMIDHEVKFVFQMGDDSNWAGEAANATNAANVHDLYDAGIGYFPMRGNHATYGWMVGDFVDSEFFSFDPTGDINIANWKSNWPQTQGLANTFGATNFSSPAMLIPYDLTGEYENMEPEENEDLVGLSYSFDYGTAGNKARFLVMDVEQTQWIWVESTPYSEAYAPAQQQQWISERFNKNTRGTEHAFILSHRQSMGQNHKESYFQSFDPNPWYASLYDNDVKYHITAHDHIYNRSKVSSPDLQSSITQIISEAGSTKYYSPGELPEDQALRETQLAQELNNVGYYVYTVDGPRVTVNYYSDEDGALQSDYCYPYGKAGINAAGNPGSCSERRMGRSNSPEVMGTWETPTFNFVKKDSFGYSLNGQEFLVGQGESYTVVQDTYNNTTAKILAGTNENDETDATPLVIDDNETPEDESDDVVTSAPRPFSKAVNTGWTAKPADTRLKTPIFSLWGMTAFDTEQTDTYVLSISFDMTKDLYIKGGGIGIAALDVNNNWVNAVNLNFGGTKQFVLGPYQSSYGLGTYGIDYTTRTAWAVLNYNADFVVMDGVEQVVRKYWRIR